MCLSYSTVAISLPLVAHRWNCQCVIPVSLIAIVPTFLEKSVFYKYLCFPWATDTVCRLLFGIQNFLGDTFGGTVYPEDISCGGTRYYVRGYKKPGANFYLTHPFLDLVSAQSSSWQTVHARVGGVQPLNLQEMDIQLRTADFEAARRMPERVEAFTR